MCNITKDDYKAISDKLNARKFKLITNDMDYRIYNRSFSGKMTKGRYKYIDRFCRKLSYHTHCGHEWDCCGCLCGQNLSFTYSRNQVIIQLTQSFNY